MLTRTLLPIIIRHGVCYLSSQNPQSSLPSFFHFHNCRSFSLARSLSLAHLTPSFDTLFVFKPTPRTIYTRKCYNDPVPLIFFVGNQFLVTVCLIQVNMHTLLSRDPKREVDSEISYVLALALYLLLRFTKDSPLSFFWPRIPHLA